MYPINLHCSSVCLCMHCFQCLWMLSISVEVVVFCHLLFFVTCSLTAPKDICQNLSGRCQSQAESVEVGAQRSHCTRCCNSYWACKWGGCKVPPVSALGEERHCRHSERILQCCHCSWWLPENAGTWEENDGVTSTWRLVTFVLVGGHIVCTTCLCAFVASCTYVYACTVMDCISSCRTVTFSFAAVINLPLLPLPPVQPLSPTLHQWWLSFTPWLSSGPQTCRQIDRVSPCVVCTIGATAMQVVIATVIQVVRHRSATPECCTIWATTEITTGPNQFALLLCGSVHALFLQCLWMLSISVGGGCVLSPCFLCHLQPRSS